MVTRRKRNRGSVLGEFVVAMVFVGIAIGPLIYYAVQIQDLNFAVGQQGRREAWRSFNDRVLATGIDPNLAPAISTALNPAIPAVTPLTVTQGNVTATAGIAQLVPLRATLDGSIAETRMAGAGYQLGAGAVVPGLSTPASPLAPIVMPAPIVTPADGTVLAVADLTAAPAGSPHTLNVRATSQAGSTVTLALQSAGQTQGLGSAQRTVTAIDLLNRVGGTAWTEYTGSIAGGDEATTLMDGRTRWFVKRSDGRLQIYEPSSTVPFAYQVSLGTPIIRRGLAENAAGTTLQFDYAAYLAVQNGTTALQIDFPTAVKAAFGSGWDAQSIGFTWTFQALGGPFSGVMREFFSSEALEWWVDSVPVAATPVIPTGAVASAGAWTLTRSKTVLGVPVRSTDADNSGFHTPGQVDFEAPPGADGVPVGRLSVDNNVSTGTTLRVPVRP